MIILLLLGLLLEILEMLVLFVHTLALNFSLCPILNSNIWLIIVV